MTGPADDMVADMVELLRQAVTEGHLSDVQVHFDQVGRGPTMVSASSDGAIPLTLLAHALVSKGWGKAS